MNEYSADYWNRLLDRLLRWWPLGFTPSSSSPWRHPWFVSPAYNAENETWSATIKPGFVNGRDVFVSVPSLPNSNTPSASLLPLTSFPSLPLGGTRAVGGSSAVSIETPGEPVPAFFSALGVKGSQTITADDLELSAPSDITAQKLSALGSQTSDLPERHLRACDLVLRSPRPYSVARWTFSSGIEGQFAQFAIDSAGASGPATLRAVPLFVESAPPDDLARLTGDFLDPGYDETLLATVYFVSPPDVAADYPLDGTWSPYVRHFYFWNISHLVTRPAAVENQNLTVNLAGLGNAAGAQINVNQLLATNNDAFAAALQFLAAREIKGAFYSPGSAKPAAPIPADRLDPPFPFVGRPIDVAWLA